MKLLPLIDKSCSQDADCLLSEDCLPIEYCLLGEDCLLDEDCLQHTLVVLVVTNTIACPGKSTQVCEEPHNFYDIHYDIETTSNGGLI